MKKLLMLLLVLVLAVGLMACTTGTGDEEPINGDDPVEEGNLVLTSDELAEYDGKDGSPAYIAVDGVVYDVTDSDMWNEGEHNGFEAGRDLTEEIMDESPHGDSVLDRLTVIGRLED